MRNNIFGQDADSLAMIQVEHDSIPVIPIIFFLWMGHRDPRVTLSTYAKVIEELEKAQKYDIGNALVPNAV